jgi:CDP-diacylglycerol---serine O-phosphatidyltransferase
MKLRDLMFVLPNLFTVTSIFCGFFAMTLCTGESGPTQLYQAALAIFFGIFFDGFDGRVARLTKTQSLFGQELDSLADVVTFGAAPSLLIFKWALQPLGAVGLFGAFLFAACGALRLARFNVLAIRSPHGGASRFFVGMPIPFAAGGLVSMVISFQTAHGGQLPDELRWPVFGAVVFLAMLMVSTVRYRTFKDLKISKPSIAVFALILAGGVFIATRVHPASVLVAYFGLYLVSGLVESVLLLRRYLVQKRTSALVAVIDGDDEDEDEDDVDEQEVL